MGLFGRQRTRREPREPRRIQPLSQRINDELQVRGGLSPDLSDETLWWSEVRELCPEALPGDEDGLTFTRAQMHGRAGRHPLTLFLTEAALIVLEDGGHAERVEFSSVVCLGSRRLFETQPPEVEVWWHRPRSDGKVVVIDFEFPSDDRGRDFDCTLHAAFTEARPDLEPFFSGTFAGLGEHPLLGQDS